MLCTTTSPLFISYTIYLLLPTNADFTSSSVLKLVPALETDAVTTTSSVDATLIFSFSAALISCFVSTTLFV